MTENMWDAFKEDNVTAAGTQPSTPAPSPVPAPAPSSPAPTPSTPTKSTPPTKA